MMWRPWFIWMMMMIAISVLLVDIVESNIWGYPKVVQVIEPKEDAEAKAKSAEKVIVGVAAAGSIFGSIAACFIMEPGDIKRTVVASGAGCGACLGVWWTKLVL